MQPIARLEIRDAQDGVIAELLLLPGPMLIEFVPWPDLPHVRGGHHWRYAPKDLQAVIDFMEYEADRLRDEGLAAALATR